MSEVHLGGEIRLADGFKGVIHTLMVAKAAQGSVATFRRQQLLGSHAIVDHDGYSPAKAGGQLAHPVFDPGQTSVPKPSSATSGNKE